MSAGLLGSGRLISLVVDGMSNLFAPCGSTIADSYQLKIIYLIFLRQERDARDVLMQGVPFDSLEPPERHNEHLIQKLLAADLHICAHGCFHVHASQSQPPDNKSG